MLQIIDAYFALLENEFQMVSLTTGLAQYWQNSNFKTMLYLKVTPLIY